tara:strand:+ start:3996 stop:4850 length:855 start_codon:yes stop_codon:yes gene_type:complete
MDDQNLVFIISQPRSGSTFLQSLLSNNPDVNTVSESWLMLTMAPLFKPSTIRSSTYDHSMAMDAYKDYCQKFDLDRVKLIREFAFKHYSPLYSGSSLIIDKTPRYWEILDELIHIFPRSKFVILKRNPEDVIRSMITTWEIRTVEKLAYLGRDLLEAPNRISKFANTHSTNPNVRNIKYENLIHDQNLVVAELYKWMNIQFEASMLDIKNNDKVQGKYGDPFINGRQKANLKIDPYFEELIRGYMFSLDDTCLKDFGLSRNHYCKTQAFSEFYNHFKTSENSKK